MFASQLLRILQTIPSDVNYKTCVYDSAEQDMIMKENQNAALNDSKSLGSETDPLAFGSKEIYQLDGLRRDFHPSLFEVKGVKFVDDLSVDNQNGTRNSTEEEFQNGLFYHLSSPEDDADPLTSEANVRDKVQSSAGDECSVAGEEFVHCDKNEPRDSMSPCMAAPDLFETDTNLYTDENVLECEVPQLIVCYKEINYHVVKDICVDEGMPANSKILTDSSKDNLSGLVLPQPLNDDSHCKSRVAVDKELLISDGLAVASLENTKGIIADKLESKEESHAISFSQGRPKLPSENSFDKDTAKDCDLEDSMHIGETNSIATSKTVIHASEEESFVGITLPIQEFGTRSFLRSFLNSLDGDGNTVKQLPDQISSGRVVPGGPAASTTEAGPKEDVQTSSSYYNSEVEMGSIMFNFNSMEPMVGGDTGITENMKEKFVDPRDVLDHKDADADNLSDAKQVHSECSKDTSTGKIHEQSPNMKDGFPSDFSASGQSHFVSSKDISNENIGDQSLDHKDKSSVDLCSNGLLPFAGSKSVNSINSDGQAVDSHVLKHDDRDPGIDSAASLRKYNEGESSFSAAGLITYSGPIAYSGSHSLRSDGSATSGRSFAFPILQPEWNSSPVRMAKADGRHFRKHKGWRSGLLCCRF